MFPGIYDFMSPEELERLRGASMNNALLSFGANVLAGNAQGQGGGAIGQGLVAGMNAYGQKFGEAAKYATAKQERADQLEREKLDEQFRRDQLAETQRHHRKSEDLDGRRLDITEDRYNVLASRPVGGASRSVYGPVQQDPQTGFYYQVDGDGNYKYMGGQMGGNDLTSLLMNGGPAQPGQNQPAGDSLAAVDAFFSQQAQPQQTVTTPTPVPAPAPRPVPRPPPVPSQPPGLFSDATAGEMPTGGSSPPAMPAFAPPPHAIPEGRAVTIAGQRWIKVDGQVMPYEEWLARTGHR